MTYEQPEALWIADWLNSHSDIGSDRAAAELRRLHEENEQLKKAVANKREWVGLTAQDLADVGVENYIGAIWADGRLQEKNR